MKKGKKRGHFGRAGDDNTSVVVAMVVVTIVVLVAMALLAARTTSVARVAGMVLPGTIVLLPAMALWIPYVLAIIMPPILVSATRIANVIFVVFTVP